MTEPSSTAAPAQAASAPSPVAKPLRQDPSARSRTAPGERSPRLGARELALAALGGLALAIVTSWPLPIHLGSRIAADLGDPVRTAWQVAWVGHALVHSPGNIFTTNSFWPHADSLAFSDSLLGYAPVAVFGSGVTAALVRYNLLFLFAYALAFFGPYLLARELGLRRAAAAVAGAAVAYAPFRIAETGHLHVVSNGGIALSLFLLLRGLHRSSAWMVLAGWLVAAWQLSLGFTLGLQFAYLIAGLTAIVLVVWWYDRRPLPPRPVLIAIVGGLIVFALVAYLESRPYLRVSNDYPTARRTIAQVERYSAGPRAFLSAAGGNRVWGDITAPIRHGLSSQNESVLFPGATIFLLALLGLWAPVFSRRLRVLLAGVAIVFGVLALGLGLTGAGYPYRILFDHFPGFDGIRTPVRLITLESLALALLAGAGAHWLLRAIARRRASAGHPGSRLPLAVGAVLVAAIVFEGIGHLGTPRVPPVPAAQLSLPGPQLELPTDPSSDRLYQLWSTAGFPTIANGNSTFDIPAQDNLRGAMHNFPDARGVRKLRRLRIRTVILHTNMPNDLPPDNFSAPEPPDPRAAAARSIAGLQGITERRAPGGLVIYTLAPLAGGR